MISPNFQVKGSDSVGPGPRKQALVHGFLCMISKQLQLQVISINDTTIGQENPGRMCKPCFTQFLNYKKLLTQLEKKLSLTVLRFDLTDSKISECAGEAIVDAPSTPPPRKKSHARSFPAFPSLTNKSFSLPVTVSLKSIYIHYLSTQTFFF